MQKEKFKVTRLVNLKGTSIRQRKEQLVDEMWIRKYWGSPVLNSLRKGEKVDVEGVKIEMVIENMAGNSEGY